MKLSEMKEYLLDGIGEYSTETTTEEHNITLPKGKERLMMEIFGESDSIYELLKEYEVKYVYLTGTNSFGVCLEERAVNAIIALGIIYKNNNKNLYSNRTFVEEKEENKSFDPTDIDLPF